MESCPPGSSGQVCGLCSQFNGRWRRHLGKSMLHGDLNPSAVCSFRNLRFAHDRGREDGFPAPAAIEAVRWIRCCGK